MARNIDRIVAAAAVTRASANGSRASGHRRSGPGSSRVAATAVKWQPRTAAASSAAVTTMRQCRLPYR
ncbi:MAG: hypothetical protein IRZ08_15180 [Frankia sp.]|nr:hypothetical protein [Frankia sp.]